MWFLALGSWHRQLLLSVPSYAPAGPEFTPEMGGGLMTTILLSSPSQTALGALGAVPAYMQMREAASHPHSLLLSEYF